MGTAIRIYLHRYSFVVQKFKHCSMMTSNLKPFVVGISGVTNGGKSTLSEHLIGLFPSPSIHIKQDDYFYPVDSPFHIQSPGGIQHINWDVISSLDMTRMVNDVKAIIDKYHLDNETGEKSKSEHRIIIVLDGFTLYDDPRIRDLCDVKLFLTLRKEICKERRINRIYDPPDIPGYFDACIWPMYLEHLKRIKTFPDIIFLEGDQDFDYVINQSKKEIYRKL